MSGTAAAGPTTGPSTGVSGPSRRRGRLATAAIVLAVVAAAVVAGLASGGPEQDGALDPQNPGPDGARAVARVLDRSGVDVTVARGQDQLAGALDGGASGTTVVVTSTGDLGPETADGLLALARGADLVVVAPSAQAAELLRLPGPPSSTGPAEELPAACDEPGVGDLRLTFDGAFTYPGRGCFAVDEGVVLAREASTSVLGAPGVLTNSRVLRADNAALALRLLGGEERLVWYVPDVADLDGADPVGVAGLLPDWLQPALGLLAIATLAAMLWRGRRLGPLATEPLPVTVRGLETTQGRGRLYHRGRDRAHAARVLRRGTRRRTAGALGLAGAATEAGPGAEALVVALSRATGRPPEELWALVADDAPPPRGDDDLTMLATSLAELEREVRPS